MVVSRRESLACSGIVGYTCIRSNIDNVDARGLRQSSLRHVPRRVEGISEHDLANTSKSLKLNINEMCMRMAWLTCVTNKAGDLPTSV